MNSAEHESPTWSPRTVWWWLAPALGVILRLRRYLDLRSVWGDEAAIGLNLLERDLLELARPLDYHQAAPVLFLWGEKLVVTAFGNTEWTLRLLPLVAGIASVFLMQRLALRLLPVGAALVAASLFAILEPAVHFSAEAKQYGVDVFAVLLLFNAITWNEPAKPRLVRYGLLGALLLWLSHPMVFVVAGLGLYGLADAIRRTDRTRTTGWLGVIGCWLLSFGAQYFLILQDTRADTYLQGFWARAFLPADSITAAATWLQETLLGVFQDPGGFSLSWLALFVFVAGGTNLCRSSRSTAWILFSPILLALAAASLGVYPFPTRFELVWEPWKLAFRGDLFHGRLILFLLPALLLGLAQGLHLLLQANPGWRRAAGACLLVLLCLGPVRGAVQRFVRPPKIQELRDVLARLEVERQPGEPVYVMGFAEDFVRYLLARTNASLEFRTIDTMKAKELLTRLRNDVTEETFWLVTVCHQEWRGRLTKIETLMSLLEFEFAIEQRIEAYNAAAFACRKEPKERKP